MLFIPISYPHHCHIHAIPYFLVGMICSPHQGSFPVRDHLRSGIIYGPGIICGPVHTSPFACSSLNYDQWEGWNWKPLEEPTLFYYALTELAANLLYSVSDEVVNIAKAFEEKTGTYHVLSNATSSSFIISHIHFFHLLFPYSQLGSCNLENPKAK